MFPNQHFDPRVLKNSVEYAASFQKSFYSFTALIEFKDQFLSGNWDGKYGLVAFRSILNEKGDVKPLSKIIYDIYEYELKSIFNFPYEVQQEIIKPIFDECRYFNNFKTETDRRSKCSLTVGEHNKGMLSHINENYFKEEKVSFTDLNVTQYAKVMVAIHNLPKDKRDRLLTSYEERCQNSIERSIENYKKTCPHLEKPFVLKIIGNDDLSYIKLFSTEEEAWSCYQTLKRESMTKCNWTLIKELGFINDD